MNTHNAENKPLVSVCMISYNHENYISQALDSVLMQKVNFKFEIVVGEDCSTDNTRKILLEYSNKYPDKFKPVLQKKNVGAEQNFFDSLYACSGKYIAYLETDDYWVDEYKLQKQLDFLENNPDYGMIHSSAKVVDENDGLLFVTENNMPSGDVFDDLIFRSSFIINCTICYRKQLIDKLLSKVKRENIKYMIDYYIWVYVALLSKIYFISDITSAYRSHSGGVTQRNTGLHSETVPYIITDIINERFTISGVKKMNIILRLKYGVKYSGAILCKGMKIKDKIKHSSFYIKHFYLIPTLFISFLSRLYLFMRRKFHFKTIF